MAVLTTPDTSGMSATLARHWNVRVREPGSGDAGWKWIKGINSFNDPVNKTQQDSSDYHSGSWTDSTSTEVGWTLEVGVQRKLDSSGEPDEGVELCRSKQAALGVDDRIEVAWWRSDSLPDSFQGFASVAFVSTGGAPNALQGGTLTFTGKGARNEVAKPTTATVTTISVSPSVATINVGETLELDVTSNAGDDVTAYCSFASSNEARATVDDFGVVTGVATGAAATITATYPGAITDTAAVTVA